jgi:hypothetical protein
MTNTTSLLPKSSARLFIRLVRSGSYPSIILAHFFGVLGHVNALPPVRVMAGNSGIVLIEIASRPLIEPQRLAVVIGDFGLAIPFLNSGV